MSAHQLRADFSFSALVAGIVVVIVGMTSSAVIVFEAASAFGLTASAAGSWLGSVCVALGVLSCVLSLKYRAPVLFAWSTPGAALLATVHGVALSDAIGAFVFSALLIALCGLTGFFERVMNRIPMAIASALLGGVLLHFSVETFGAFKSAPVLIGAMLAAYLLVKKIAPRWTMLAVLITGIAASAATGRLQVEQLRLATTDWHLTMPTFSPLVLVSVGLPLFLVTMASQNVTGFTIMRVNGYQTPVSPLMSASGIVNLFIAPFGGFAINLAAITAAMAMGPEAHPDPKRRYVTGVVSGVLYILIGLMATTVTSLFAAFPREMVIAIAGLALLSTIVNCLRTALAVENEREAAFLTFVVAASGVTFAGLSAAFWALVLGLLTLFWLRPAATA